jgi:hypothetical protein
MSAEYLFGPLERRGVFLGARLGQIVVMLAATATVVAILTAMPSPLGAAFAASTMLAAGIATLVPVAGRTPEQWTPVLAGFVTARLTRNNLWISPAQLRGHRLLGAATGRGHEVGDPTPHPGHRSHLHVVPRSESTTHVAGSDDAPDETTEDLVRDVHRVDAGDPAPPYLLGIELLSARWVDGDIGVLADRRARTYTAVLALGATSPALADDDARAQRLDHWGAVLAGVTRDGGGAITRLQWLERTTPNDSEAAVQHLVQHQALDVSNPFVRSYLSLLDDHGAATQCHEVLLAVQVSASRASAPTRRLRRGIDLGSCSALSRDLLALARSLGRAEVEVRGVLSPRMLAASLRSAADPRARERLAQRSAVDPHSAGASPRTIAPHRSAASWSSFCTDGAHHATFWVAEWPRSVVGTDWLSPLLLGTRCQRTVSVVMEPSAPLRALRRVEATRVDDETTSSLRQRFGFRRSVRHQRESDNVARAEEELNEGHQQMAVSAYITVTAANAAALASACTEVEQHAALSRLDIRREYGTQDVAFTYTLPLCRGLR